MIPELGFTFIIMAFLISFSCPFIIFFGSKFSNQFDLKNSLKISQYSAAIIAGLCALSMLCLIYCYVVSDFSVTNVYLNSHHLKPLIYKISGTWGNHEGSILLLVTILSFYSVAFAFLSNVNSSQKILIICSQLIITCGILAFIILTSSPFLRLFPIPSEGLGLNPILQDIGLALHPPMLYTGYIGFSLIFSFAISALILKEIDQKFAENIRPWLMFSWSFLTLGIGLGSFWAYRELGWGGYWFWDPVENVSLMPWLCATALIHCIIMLKKTGNFRIWSCFLSIMSFVFCLLGIFLVRSGVLTSVHSFANDPKRGIFIILLLLFLGGGGFLIFFIQSLKLKTFKSDFAIFSKAGLVLINNFLLCLALFVVVLGTLYPLILQSLFDSSISIGPFYYQQILSPLAILILLLMILTPYAKLTVNKGLNKKLMIILISGILVIILSVNFQNHLKPLPLMALFFSMALIFTCAFHQFRNRQKITINNSLMFLGHLGIAVIIIGIAANALFCKTKELNMKLGESVSIANYQITFSALDYAAGKNYLARIGIFTINDQNKKFQLSPETRYYPVSDQSTTEAAIKHKLTEDLYLVIGNKDENENFAVRIYYKPFISFIWFGCLILFVSGILSLIGILLNKRLKINS